MTVNLVVKPGWILERLARELQARLDDVTVNAGEAERAVDPSADLNYYLPARDIQKYPTAGRAIGFYTHGETALDLVKRFDACVCMNQAMRFNLEAAGAEAPRLIRPGIDRSDRGPITFGVIGRVYNSGRKGEALVARAVAAGYRLVACGPTTRVRAMSRRQWPCPQPFTLEDREAFYRAIDYLLVPSLEEGGPMPVFEAIARGVPVIAPDVGWCWELPVIRYTRGEWSSLAAVLEALTHPPTWEDWAAQHDALFAELEVRAS